MHRTWALSAVLLWLLATVAGEFYETYSGKQISPFKYAEYQALGLVPYCAQEIKTCDEHEKRRADYSCNNLHHPIRGTTMSPYRRLLSPKFGRGDNFRPQMSGTPLPSARAVRTSLLSDGRVADKKWTSQLMGGLLIVTTDSTTVHDIFNYVVFTPTCCVTGDSDPRCRPIYVPNNDIHLRYSTTRCINLTRPITYQDLGCAPPTLPPERINLAPPQLELSNLYGDTETRMVRGREMRGGRLKTEFVNGKEWPPSGSYICVQNQLTQGETRCHDSPSLISNLLIQDNVFIIWLYRNHNRLARQLELMNPCWNDELIFSTVREIQIAILNQIWYYEMFAQLLGYDYLKEKEIIYDTKGHINDYDPKLEPLLSIEYILTTRWFHNMQDGRLNKYSQKGKLLQELNIVDYNLRTGALPLNNTIEGITQGFFRQGSAKADYVIDPEMGERVLGSLQAVSDIASIDIQRGREAAVPPYVEYRKFCKLKVPKKFDDLLEWMPAEKVDSLRFRYEKVEDIELHPGIMGEKLEGTLPPTAKCIVAEQLWWWRKSDRFWYENNQHPGAFTKEQLLEIRKATMSSIVCDNGDDVNEIQPKMFFLPDEGNEIVSCSKIPSMSLKPWKDHCGKDHPEPKETSESEPENSSEEATTTVATTTTTATTVAETTPAKNADGEKATPEPEDDWDFWEKWKY
ncbi:peroxidase-like [Hyposmocoma kahamanoa]|uniref:peroxidase-like n=1 Tax=Hyposmocoma kahamanoa TaxID=1477025 RepID=UPI000E6D80DB|nr:peroxidase-like [Hyposmocoma kahamanoa]